MHWTSRRRCRRRPTTLDCRAEIADFLGKFLARAEENGIALESMVCDPGFGFGKTLTHNLSLLRDLETFQRLRRPMLVGLSRKSFLNLVGGREPLEIHQPIGPYVGDGARRGDLAGA